MKKYFPETMLLLMTAIWGATFMFIRMGVANSTPSTYVILRFSTALILCLLFFWRQIVKIDKKTFNEALILGIFFVLGYLLQTNAVKLTTISKTAFITGLTVVIVPFVYFFLQKKKPGIFSGIGVIIGFTGLYIFTKPDFSNINLGDLLTFISTFCWAFYITLMDKYTRHQTEFSHTIQLITGQFIVAIPLAAINLILFERIPFYFHPNLDLFYSVAFNGVIASFFLLLIHTTYQKHTTPVRAGLIFSLEPIFASIFAYIFLKEYLNSRELLGAAIMMSAVLVSELGALLYRSIGNRT